MVVSVSGLVKEYAGARALDGLDLEVAEGELFAFLGPNGAGKTTTIRILNGLTAMTAGRAAVCGVDIVRNPLEARRLCGLASQHINLDGDLTTAENLEFHGRLFGMPRSRRRARAAELLEYVEMADRADSLAKTLSGGLKRRLMVARALMHEPRLLFLDEPTVGLDPAIRRRIWGLVRKLNKDGVGVFLTTHYIEEAEFLADRVGFIHDGRLVGQGRPADIVSGLGAWAVDRFDGSETGTAYFGSREEAHVFMRRRDGEAVLRRVNLEDAFLAITGRKVR